jgi:hypothetical protein
VAGRPTNGAAGAVACPGSGDTTALVLRLMAAR